MNTPKDTVTLPVPFTYEARLRGEAGDRVETLMDVALIAFVVEDMAPVAMRPQLHADRGGDRALYRGPMGLMAAAQAPGPKSVTPITVEAYRDSVAGDPLAYARALCPSLIHLARPMARPDGEVISDNHDLCRSMAEDAVRSMRVVNGMITVPISEPVYVRRRGRLELHNTDALPRQTPAYDVFNVADATIADEVGLIGAEAQAAWARANLVDVFDGDAFKWRRWHETLMFASRHLIETLHRELLVHPTSVGEAWLALRKAIETGSDDTEIVETFFDLYDLARDRNVRMRDPERIEACVKALTSIGQQNLVATATLAPTWPR